MKAPITPIIRSPTRPNPVPSIIFPASQPATIPTKMMTIRLSLERYMAIPSGQVPRCRGSATIADRRLECRAKGMVPAGSETTYPDMLPKRPRAAVADIGPVANFARRPAGEQEGRGPRACQAGGLHGSIGCATPPEHAAPDMQDLR